MRSLCSAFQFLAMSLAYLLREHAGGLIGGARL
jgi:hypothetical protein